MPTLFIRCLVFIVLLIATIDRSSASVYLSNDDVRIYKDASDLSFEALLALENKDINLFIPFSELNKAERIFWIKITNKRLGAGGYLLLSNFIEKIEAFYPSDSMRYSLSGSKVNFEQRDYNQGFYRQVLPLKEKEMTVYIKITSIHAYAYINQSLSHLQIVSDGRTPRLSEAAVYWQLTACWHGAAHCDHSSHLTLFEAQQSGNQLYCVGLIGDSLCLIQKSNTH